MGQAEVSELLKENLFLNIGEIRNKLNLTESNASVNNSLNQMIKYDEVKAYSVNRGSGIRVIYYGLMDNQKKMYKKMKRLYGKFGDVEDFYPLSVIRFRKKVEMKRKLKEQQLKEIENTNEK